MNKEEEEEGLTEEVSTVKPSKEWRRPVPGDGQERRLMPRAPVIRPANPSRRTSSTENPQMSR
jgi:hypothetical protein